MSYVGLLVVEKSGLVKQYARALNNHGYAPLVWDFFSKKYSTYTGPYSVTQDQVALRATWDLAWSDKLNRLERLLLAGTFDRVWINRENIPGFVESLEWFHREHVLPGKFVETAQEMASHLKKLCEEKPDALGVALDQCSANESWWQKRIPFGKDGKPLHGNGEAYDYDYEPLNILTDKLLWDDEPHWEIGTIFDPKAWKGTALSL